MKTILLTDDDKNIREFCRRELEDEGYRVLSAAHGAEALALIEQHAPDVVILDLCMPIMGGLEATKRIREIAPTVPIIYFTAHDEDCLTDGRSQLATACVEKEPDLTELKRIIQRALAATPAREALRRGLP